MCPFIVWACNFSNECGFLSRNYRTNILHPSNTHPNAISNKQIKNASTINIILFNCGFFIIHRYPIPTRTRILFVQVRKTLLAVERTCVAWILLKMFSRQCGVWGGWLYEHDVVVKTEQFSIFLATSVRHGIWWVFITAMDYLHVFSSSVLALLRYRCRLTKTGTGSPRCVLRKCRKVGGI